MMSLQGRLWKQWRSIGYKMTRDFSYYMPTKIVYKIGAINNLEEHISGRKVLLVTSQGHIKRGLLEKLKNIEIVEIVDDIKTHPEFKDLEKIYEKILHIPYDSILAIGGGSVIDSAKYLSVCNAKKDKDFVTKLIKKKTKEDYLTKPIISIPTTAGTSSEITPWATIWDMDEKKKYSLHLPELFSQVAIYDPTLTLSVPKDITVQTALDTLSHALESIWNKNANEITINYAIRSAKLVMEYLPKLVDDLENLEYRDKIMKASMYAGLAFSNTQTAIAHAMSYYITAYKNVPHGIACSFTLPMLIDKVIGKYEFVDNALKEIFGELSSEKLYKLLKDLQISTQFEDYDIDGKEKKDIEKTIYKNPRAQNSLI